MANKEIVFKINANADFKMSMQEVSAAESRAQLNKAWVRNNALLELDDGSLKMVERVTMSRGEPYELVARSNFNSSEREGRVADEFRCKISDLTSGSANNVKSVLFGFFGVPFPTAPRKMEEVVEIHGVEGDIREVSVLAWSGEGRRPSLATALKFNVDIFLGKIKTKIIGKVRRSEPAVELGPFPLVAEALAASGLGESGRLEATQLGQFLGAVLDVDPNQWGPHDLATRLRGLQERMEGQGGPQPPWRWAREAGILDEMTALKAGEALRNMYWAVPRGASEKGRKRGRPAAAEDEPDDGRVGGEEDLTSSSEDEEEEGDAGPHTAAANRQRPTLVEDSDSEVEEQVAPQRRRVNASAFASVVPAGMDQLEAARIFFDSARIREVAACDEVPDVVPDAYQEALIMRYTKAFDRLCDRAGTG
jgi:hypothetical protein